LHTVQKYLCVSEPAAIKHSCRHQIFVRSSARGRRITC
jgi:hypothetical protein